MTQFIDELALTEQHLAEEEALCTRQTAVIAHVRAAGRNSARAEEVLVHYEQTLQILRTHKRRLQTMEAKRWMDQQQTGMTS
ncbi:hypothetical protein [Methylobacterium nigriterrae]|uniref:hypothetical protein n=1 Tax=Methylobacterium nigriterrae TaxID=3127512 RepID=UPI003013C6BE